MDKIEKRKLILPLGISIISCLVAIGLLFYKPMAALIASIGIFFASLIPWITLLYTNTNMQSKTNVLAITFIRFGILVLTCSIPGIVWYFTPGFKEEVHWIFLFFGAIEALIYYLSERINILAFDIKEEYKDKKE